MRGIKYTIAVLCVAVYTCGCATIFDVFDKYKGLIEPNEATNDVEIVTNDVPPDVQTNATPKPDYGKYHPDGPTNSHAFLWKSISDNDKKLCVILPHTVKIPDEVHLNPDFVSYVLITEADMVTVQGKQTKCSMGNGNRSHWRFPLPGGGYNTNAWAFAVLKDGRQVGWHIAQTGLPRTEKRKPDVIK